MMKYCYKMQASENFVSASWSRGVAGKAGQLECEAGQAGQKQTDPTPTQEAERAGSEARP